MTIPSLFLKGSYERRLVGRWTFAESTMKSAGGTGRSRQRLFIALEVGVVLRRALAMVADRLKSAGLRGRFVPPENYHVTLVFLGAVASERLGVLEEAVGQAAAGATPIFLALDRLVGFPRDGAARVVSVGATPGPQFAALRESLRVRLAPIGFSLSAHGDAHVTLCRCPHATSLPRLELEKLPPLRSGHLTLFASFTERTGARYVSVKRFALRNADRRGLLARGATG